MKVWGKNFWLIFKPFLTNRSKNEDEDEKIWEYESDIWIFHIKIRLYGIFYKNLRKKFFFEIFTLDGHTRTEVSKGLIKKFFNSG